MKLLGDLKLKKYIGHHPLWLVDGVIFIGTFLLLLGHALTDWPISGDGTRYLTYAKSIAGETRFYYDRYLPPLYPFLTYLLHQILPGTWEFHGRLVSVLSGSFFGMIVFRFIRKLVNLKTAFVCFFMLLSYRFFLRYGAETQTESLYFLLMLFQILVVYKLFFDAGNLKYWLLLVVTSLSLLLTRGSGVLIILWSMAVLVYPVMRRKKWKLLGILLGIGIGVSILVVAVIPNVIQLLLEMAARIEAFEKTFLFFTREGYYWWLKTYAYAKHPAIWTGLSFFSGMGFLYLFSSANKKKKLFGFLLISLMLYLVAVSGSFYGILTFKPFYTRYNIPAGILAVLLSGFGIVGLADQVVNLIPEVQNKRVAKYVWSGVAVSCVCMGIFMDSFWQNYQMIQKLRAGKIVNEYRVAGEWMLENYPEEAFLNFGSDAFVPFYANVYGDRPMTRFDYRDPSQDKLIANIDENGYRFVVIDEKWVKDEPWLSDMIETTLWYECTEIIKRFDIKNPSLSVKHSPISIYKWLSYDECH